MERKKSIFIRSVFIIASLLISSPFALANSSFVVDCGPQLSIPGTLSITLRSNNGKAISRSDLAPCIKGIKSLSIYASLSYYGTPAGQLITANTFSADAFADIDFSTTAVGFQYATLDEIFLLLAQHPNMALTKRLDYTAPPAQDSLGWHTLTHEDLDWFPHLEFLHLNLTHMDIAAGAFDNLVNLKNITWRASQNAPYSDGDKADAVNKSFLDEVARLAAKSNKLNYVAYWGDGFLKKDVLPYCQTALKSLLHGDQDGGNGPLVCPK